MQNPNDPFRTKFSHSTRRGFLKTAIGGTTALAMTAQSYSRVLGANERIAIGVIGCGNRGFGAHMPGVQKHSQEQNVEITAVCDVWTKYRQRAVDQVKEWNGRRPFETTNYQDLLARDQIDAVMIASCDFHHARMLEETAQAGKDAYCEKPLAMDFDELKRAYRAVKENGIIVQVGTQRRSNPAINGARRLYQNGTLGQVSRIEIFRNSPRPNWYKRLDRMPISESEVDWQQFLMHRPHRPFDDLLFAGWYGFREFCSGSIGQFMSHYADLVNYLTGSTFPSSAVAHGDTFVWKDEYQFDCRDQVQVSLVYPEGFLFTYSTNFGNGSGSRNVVYGTEGMMELSRKLVISSKGAYGKSQIEKAGLADSLARPLSTSGKASAKYEVEPVACPDHFLDWLQALRSRKQPVAPIEAGYEHSVACIMADRAMQTGRRQIYDRDQREIRAG